MLLTLLRVRQNCPSLIHLFEHLLSSRLLLIILAILVGVPLKSQFSVGLLNRLLIILLRDPQNLVVVLLSRLLCLLLRIL